MAKMTWSTLAAAVAELGEVKALSYLNQFAANKAYRKAYTADRNAAIKIVRNDPRYKAILAETRAAVAPQAAPVLRKKA